MEHHKFSVPKTAHFYTIGEVGKHVKRLVIALHGYGQAARSFVYKFEGLDDGNTLVICPEGLNRFYWENFTGKVVASWMTKQDREIDIYDNMNYLSALYDYIVPQLSDDVSISLMGFSQGCPTISRWAASNKPRIDNLILWAGQLAHDQDYAQAKDYFKKVGLHWVVGKEDGFITEERLEKQIGIANTAGMDFEVTKFDGAHEVDRKTLEELFQRLSTVRKLF